MRKTKEYISDVQQKILISFFYNLQKVFHTFYKILSIYLSSIYQSTYLPIYLSKYEYPFDF